MNKPMIGDFRSPTGNAPRVVPTTPDTASTDAPAVPDVTAPLVTETASTEAAAPSKALTPAEVYQDRLKEAGIDLYEARSIIDRVIIGGSYEESFQLVGRKGTFRTRSYEDQLRVSRALELENPTTGVAQSDIIVRYNLAASLVEWAGTKYDSKPVAERLDLLNKFPAPLINLLSRELSKFDGKMMLIFSDGAIDSF